VDRKAFESVIQEALEGVPERFQHALENVAIVVKAEPDPADTQGLGTAELFGLYHGVPLTERGGSHTGLPDTIEIYQGPILRSCDTTAEIVAEIRDTLIHELGHHMGLSDDEMAY
jgi:predicted Zn-dependent protease with MMP-like domain